MFSRGDPIHKFYIIFFKSICWFHPFIWKCLRKNEEDMELSCDESEKRKYPSLILNTVGDERGFTPCLSASGEALKYRMSNILHDSKKKVGYPVILVSIGIESNCINDSLGENVEYVSWAYNCNYEDCYDSNQIQKVIDYLNSLKMYRVESIDPGDDYSFAIVGRKKENYYDLYIYDQAIVVSGNDQDEYIMEYYYVKDEIDQKHIDRLLA